MTPIPPTTKKEKGQKQNKKTKKNNCLSLKGLKKFMQLSDHPHPPLKKPPVHP